LILPPKDCKAGRRLPLDVLILGDTQYVQVRIWDAIRPLGVTPPQVKILYEGAFDDMRNPFPFHSRVLGLHSVTVQAWDERDLTGSTDPFVYAHIDIGVH
jgi:hypothetical protein